MKRFGRIMLGFAFAIMACLSVVLVGCENKSDSTNPSSSSAGLYQNGERVKSWDDLKKEFPDAFIETIIVGRESSPSYFEGISGELVIDNSVFTIGGSAFKGCTSLESVTIPDSVTSIGYYAFMDCASLESIVIPDSVTWIGNDAFEGCTSVKSIVIGNGVTSIGWRVFKGCTSLKSVVIGNGVTRIGWREFEGCTSLESVTIPDSVTSIGAYAFMDCASLETVIIDSADIAVLDSSDSDLLSNTTTVYVKTGLTVGAYVTNSFEKQASSDKVGYDKYSKTP